MRLAAILVAFLVATGAAEAGPAEKLGDAYRAYDAGDVDAAARLLAGLREDQLVNDDYLFWLRGQVALVRGEPRQALAAFENLRAAGGSRFA